jgi:hypothetical protein
MREIDQDLEGIGQVQTFLREHRGPTRAARAASGSFVAPGGWVNTFGMVVGGLPHVFSR